MLWRYGLNGQRKQRNKQWVRGVVELVKTQIEILENYAWVVWMLKKQGILFFLQQNDTLVSKWEKNKYICTKIFNLEFRPMYHIQWAIFMIDFLNLLMLLIYNVSHVWVTDQGSNIILRTYPQLKLSFQH